MANANAPERVVNGIKTRVLHNKDYVEVAERVRIMHALDKPFEMVESAPFEIGNRLVWRVVVRFDERQFIGNAEVKLDAPKNTPDGTNPFECAETSAIGRALAFAGLGTVESISSYDEIARSQPFVAVVEQPRATRVVEASNGQRQPSAPIQDSEDAKALKAIMADVKSAGLASDTEQWTEWKKGVLGADVPNAKLSHEQITQLQAAVEKSKNAA